MEISTSKFPRKINLEHNSGIRKKNNEFDIELGTWIQHAIDKGWITLPLSGSGSGLFPNGFELVETSRDFQASDAGKRLFVLGTNINISMPEINPFAVGDYVGIINGGTDVSFEINFGETPIYPTRTGDGSTSECVILMNTYIEEEAWLFPISTSIILDETDSIRKTMEKYLYDNIGFRGTATLSSGTVTVATDKIKTGYKIYLSVNTPSGTQGFLSAPIGSIVDATSFVINSTNAGDNSTVNWWIAP
jgi:hypothetical protein